MKRLIKNLCAVGTALTSLSSPIFADCCAQPCNYEWTSPDHTFTLGADWLYWRPDQDNMVIGTAFTNDFDQIGDLDGVNYSPKFKYENGYRVHAGYQLPCDCWSIDVAYNYLPAAASWATFVRPNSDSEFITVLSDFDHLHDIILPEIEEYLLFDNFASKWNSTINFIDVDLARNIEVTDCFSIKPHMGFRAAWIDQKIRYLGNSDEDFLIDGLMTQKFRGYGVEGGLWGEFKFACGLSIIGHFGGSLMYSKMQTFERETVSFYEEGVPVPFFNFEVHNSHKQGIPTVDYFLGLKYQNTVCNVTYDIHAGWEAHNFFSMNALSTNGGDLMLQGLTLGMDIGF